MPDLERIVILDFGSQYTQLIARRIRELGVYSEIFPGHIARSSLELAGLKGIILSGGPASVAGQEHRFDSGILDLPVPCLGICYGMQLLTLLGEGRVRPMGRGEYGQQTVSVDSKGLFRGLKQQQQVWMSHGDSIEQLAMGYEVTARSQDGLVAAIQHTERPCFGLQFHPEVTHTEAGKQILANFLSLCHCTHQWTMDHCLEQILSSIREQVGDGRVVSLVSGGVDSTVATQLCQRALRDDQIIPLHIDTGLMREGESDQVEAMLGLPQLQRINAQETFLEALRGVADPEQKRKIIGRLFIEVLETELNKVEQVEGQTFFCQGTLYTDLIESGKGCGKGAAVIKSHHNVNPPIVEQKRKAGLLVEPNAAIFKDEVRKLAELLGIPRELAWRHPFPGPGLAIRILGEVTEEHLRKLRHADRLYLEEIRRAGLYDKIWQAFAVLIPVTTVGVMGDSRTEGNVIALRAIDSVDGMTAQTCCLPHEVLQRIASRIANEVPGINRVVYDLTSKPPATIEWE
jgi:GMP synthase (glutamine-hydrolysing)